MQVRWLFPIGSHLWSLNFRHVIIIDTVVHERRRRSTAPLVKQVSILFIDCGACISALSSHAGIHKLLECAPTDPVGSRWCGCPRVLAIEHRLFPFVILLRRVVVIYGMLSLLTSLFIRH